MITIEHKTGEYLAVTQASITTSPDGGFASASSTGGASLTGSNTAEDYTYRYTLNGDSLTIVSLPRKEPSDIDFSGAYTRGAPVEETFNTGGDSESGTNGSDIESTWSGRYATDDGKVILSIGNFWENSFRFIFIAGADNDGGYAEVNLDEPDHAEGADYTFRLVDDDGLLVSGGAYEGSYTRDSDD